MKIGRKTRASGSFLALALGCVATAAICVGCFSAAPPAGTATPTTGTPGSAKPTADSAETETINVEGSSTVFLIAQSMANEFEKKTNHKVSVGRSGTTGGYKKFVVRQSDIWSASRPIVEKEVAELKEKGISWLELEVGIDGLSIAVNPKNDWCDELTIAQLRAMWSPDNSVNKWSEINPAWPDQNIEFFGADTESGTFEYFTEVVVGKKGKSRVKYQAASDDNVLIAGVAGSKFSLGYIPFGYCVGNKDKVKVIKISPTVEAGETRAPAVEPTTETILSGEYKPLARPLFIYVNLEATKRPEVVEFLKFFISEESQPLVTKRGFVRIPDERLKEMQAKLEAALKPAETASAN